MATLLSILKLAPVGAQRTARLSIARPLNRFLSGGEKIKRSNEGKMVHDSDLEASRKRYQGYQQVDFGRIYDKKPTKFTLKAGKAYMWCACGYSSNQPFCDGTHSDRKYKLTMKPVRYDCTETKDVWLCNCKQTKNRPFCDGSHNSQQVKEAESVIKYY